ncbi:phage head closure protein [Gimesia maris]|uniref:phage head closure protein n=1 Tax=Gimesia maris TaxID=122 RepID=UPI0030D844CF|tara:strand:- start:122671 stop:122985 length:315 start_codon:yes stop_codon:yes gene_type:complete
MEAGKLRHRIDIQQASESRNDLGEVNESWSSLSERWASIEPLQGRELEHAQQISEDINFKITLRHMTGVTPEHRITFNGRTFHILSVINTMEQNKELVLLCKED